MSKIKSYDKLSNFNYDRDLKYHSVKIILLKTIIKTQFFFQVVNASTYQRLEKKIFWKLIFTW